MPGGALPHQAARVCLSWRQHWVDLPLCSTLALQLGSRVGEKSWLGQGGWEVITLKVTKWCQAHAMQSCAQRGSLCWLALPGLGMDGGSLWA